MCASDRAYRILGTSHRQSWVPRQASVMIEKFAAPRGTRLSEFLDLNHTGNLMILVSLLIPKFASGPGV